MECKYCGKKYIKFRGMEFIPQSMRDKMPEYVPDCDCLEKKSDEEAEQKRLEAIKDQMIKNVMKFREISVADEKFYSYTFENSDLDGRHMALASEYTEAYLKNNNSELGIMFYGGVGNGKTRAVACMANKLMQNKKTVLALSLSGYLNRLRKNWAEAELDVLKKVKKVDFLIIDDFGTENVTEWVLEKVFNIIDARYRTNKPILITTNLDIKNIETKFDQRISDRIKEMCFQHNVKEKSRRGTGVKEKMKNFLGYEKRA